MPGEKNKKKTSDPKTKKEVSIIVLNDPKGASGFGHLAIMVKNSRGVWEFVSKEGRQKNHWYSPNFLGIGELIGAPALPPLIEYFSSWQDFRKAQQGDSPYAKNLAGYTEAIALFANAEQDSLALNTVEKAANSYYNVLWANCADATSGGLSVAGFNPGYDYTMDPRPNVRFKNIKEDNANYIDTSFHPFEKPTMSMDMKYIQNKIDDLQQQKNAYMPEMGALSMLATLPFGLTPEQKQKLQTDTQTTNVLQNKIDDLKHIQKELQKVQPVNKPFPIPDMPNWKKKGADTDTNQQLGPLFGPPFYSPDNTNENPFMPKQARYLVDPDNGAYQMPAVPIMNNSGSKLSPVVTSSISPAHIAPPAGSQNRGGGGCVTFHVQGGLSSHTNKLHPGLNNTQHNIHDSVVAILTSAVADAKIGTDIH